jgi:acetyltransferase-like isoleucine patch superfamily enzyme
MIEIFNHLRRGVRTVVRRREPPPDPYRNLILSSDVAPEALQGARIRIMEGSRIDAASRIQSYTFVGHNCFITKTDIGRYCSIANNVSTGQGEHKLERISTSALFYGDSYKELTEGECVIGNDVWVGTESVIRRGVTIGSGAVIGANSVVMTDVPEFAVFAGTPAKLIKYRFSADQIRALKDSGWWELEMEEARDIVGQLEASPLFSGLTGIHKAAS